MACLFTLLDHGIDIFAADSSSEAKHSLLILVAMSECENDNVFCKPVLQWNNQNCKTQPIYLSFIDRLLQAGLDINACDIQNMNALLWAVWRNNVHIIDLLLCRGANYLQINSVNYTILHLAACRGSIETLRVLRTHSLAGLRMDAELEDGTTPLDIAVGRKNLSNEWIVAWDALVQSIIAADLALENENCFLELREELHDEENG